MGSLSQSVKTVLLLGVLTGLLLAIGGLAGGRTGMTFALGFSLLINLGSWWFSDKLVILMTGAKPASAAEFPGLHRIVEELSRQAGIPKPAVFVVPERSPNAFATGRGPGHAAVAVHTGLLELMSEREVKGVLAHELAHIRNRDTLVSSVAASLAGAIMYLAYMMRWVGLFAGGGGDDEDRGGNVLVLLLISILAPLAAMFIQMAISRSREYKADASGAAISRDPGGLADALQKLGVFNQRIPTVHAAAATVHHIVHPFSGRSLVNLFSTHPPLEERIRRLRELAATGGRRGT